MARQWSADDVLALARGYQGACVLAAAVDLDLFSALAEGPKSAPIMAAELGVDLRGITILLDALASLELLDKRAGAYALSPGLADLLSRDGTDNILPMAQHQANCLRRWVQLSRAVLSGKPAERTASIRGEAADLAAFIGAMHCICRPVAAQMIEEIGPQDFTHVLDVGGGSGTWTIAFLRANAHAQATIFDLPEVIPLAEQRISAAGLEGRVRLAAGDFLTDQLPTGADLAWVSAIVHQNSRAENRRLFANVCQALRAPGRIIIRDVLMDESRISPAAGALFAINMLVATEGGGTFTFDELRADLEAAGFCDAAVLRRDEAMNSLVSAVKRAG